MLVALAASVGMSWAISPNYSSGTTIPGWYVPDSYVNVTDADGWMSTEVIPGFVGAPIFLPGTTTFESATDHPARFGVFAAILAILASAWFNNRRLQVIGGLVLIVTTAMTSGLGLQASGSSIGWLAGLLLIVLEMPAIKTRLPRL
jgi:MFS superfamily sulfate permease-like transporter